MDRAERVRQAVESLNERDFEKTRDLYRPDVLFHAPGLGADVQGQEAMEEVVGGFIRSADIHYDDQEVVVHGPFAVSLVRSTGIIDGQRMTWDLCQVLRFEGDQVAEAWALRGGQPRPASGD